MDKTVGSEGNDGTIGDLQDATVQLSARIALLEKVTSRLGGHQPGGRFSPEDNETGEISFKNEADEKRNEEIEVYTADNGRFEERQFGYF